MSLYAGKDDGRRDGLGDVVEAGMEDQANYTVSGDPLEMRYSERQALEKIASRLAKRIYLRTMERF